MTATCYRDGVCTVIDQLRPFAVASMGTPPPGAIRTGEATCPDCGATWRSYVWADESGLTVVA